MTTAEEFLAHHGVKGMKWGVRKDRGGSSGPTPVTVKPRKPGAKIKVTGGKGHTATPEAIGAAIARQKAKKSTVNSLSNKELEDAIKRMNLERQFKQLRTDHLNPGKKFAAKLLIDTGKTEVTKAVATKVAKTTVKLVK